VLTEDPIANTLDVLAPPQDFNPDWDVVRSQAGLGVESHQPRARPRFTLRKGVLALAVAVGILVPLGSLSATGNLWILQFPIPGETSKPAPGTSTDTTTTSPIVLPRPPYGPEGVSPAAAAYTVKTGTWDGQGWQLAALVGDRGDLCFGVTPSETAHGSGPHGGVNCAQVDGVPRPPSSPNTNPAFPLEITYVMQSRTSRLPAYIVGPVIGTARSVDVYFANGEVLHTPAFEVPSALGAVRFYATSIPDSIADSYLTTPPRLDPTIPDRHS